MIPPQNSITGCDGPKNWLRLWSYLSKRLGFGAMPQPKLALAGVAVQNESAREPGEAIPVVDSSFDTAYLSSVQARSEPIAPTPEAAPLPTLRLIESEQAKLPPEAPVTITVSRMVRRGQKQRFEQLLREFIPQSLSHPGHWGLQVLKPAPGSYRYAVMIHFRSLKDWQEFQHWPEYLQWQRKIRHLLEREPEITIACGLENWLAWPDNSLATPLPRWQTFLLTWCGVYPTALTLTICLTPILDPLPLALRTLIQSGIMVSLLTWLVMPIVSRWLKPILVARFQSEEEGVVTKN